MCIRNLSAQARFDLGGSCNMQTRMPMHLWLIKLLHRHLMPLKSSNCLDLRFSLQKIGLIHLLVHKCSYVFQNFEALSVKCEKCKIKTPEVVSHCRLR